MPASCASRLGVAMPVEETVTMQSTSDLLRKAGLIAAPSSLPRRKSCAPPPIGLHPVLPAMRLGEPGKRPRRMALADAGIVEDAGQMQILKRSENSRRGVSTASFWVMTCSGAATARLSSFTVSFTECSSVSRRQGRTREAPIYSVCHCHNIVIEKISTPTE
jgi:hypothetical protein